MLHTNTLIAGPQQHAFGADDDVAGSNKQMAAPMLLQYWQMALRWKWAILAIVVFSVIMGLVVTVLSTPKYTARARIEISRDQKNVTKVEGLDSPAAGRDLEFYQTKYSLLAARSLAERVSRKLQLASNDAFFESHGVNPDDTSSFLGGDAVPGSSATREKRERKAVALLLKNIGISPIRASALIDISYVSASPGLSAQIVNTWTQQFIEQSMDRRFAATADARKFLEGRLEDLRGRVEQSERDLVNYATAKGIVALSQVHDADGKTQTDRTLVASDLEALNMALAKATADRFIAESKAGSTAIGGSNADALKNDAITTLRLKRAEAAAERSKLLVQFESDYPVVKALDQQIGALDASIGREEGRVTTSRKAEYQEALSQEDLLSRKVESLKLQLGTQRRDSIQYNIYQREADTNKQLYDALLQRYKEIGVAGVGSNDIAIVDNAQVPTIPSSPNLPINLAFALLAGLGLAGGAAIALNHIDEGLRDPTQVDRLLHVPFLGSIPEIDAEHSVSMLLDPKSVLSEAYLSVRSSLAFSTDHGVPRTLMVTSTRPSEGKSTTSLGLAMVIGRTGKSVVLVDGDMRSPSLHGFMELPNHAGLSNFLAGDNDWERLIAATPAKGVSLLAAGPHPPSAAELLSSDRMVILVQKLLEKFDHVLIDSPPILGLADAPLLSRAVEGCIFAVEADGVAIRGIRASLQRLRLVHAQLFGVVLTKFKLKHANYGYGYGYGYSYGEAPELRAA